MGGAFTKEFLPIVRPEENIKRMPQGEYYQVVWVEPLADIDVYDFGAIAALDETDDKEIEDLYLNDGEFGQYQLIPLDDIKITVWQPKAVGRFATKDTQGAITVFTNQRFPTDFPARIFIWEDNDTYFKAKNPSNYPLYKARVKPFGYRFIVEKLSSKPEHYTVIPFEGWRAKGE